MQPMLEVLDHQEIAEIHAATVEVLEKVGIEFKHEEVLKIFKDNGARVEGQRVFINSSLLNKAIKLAPARFLLEARNPEKSVWIGGNEPICAPPAGCVNVQELDNFRREAVLQDYLNLVRIIHQSPYYGTNGGGLVTPSSQSFRGELEKFAWMVLAGHWFSDKPQMSFTYSGEIAQIALALSQIVFEGKPGYHVLGTINPDSPLTFSSEMLESLILYAQSGQPLIVAPCSMAMATSPATLAGTLVQNNSEVLAGLVLIQLVNPGNPMVYGNTSTIADMSTMAIALGAPELSLLVSSAAQLARYYELPSRTGGALTDAKTPDIQAGMESMLSIITTTLSQASIVMHAAGILDSFLTISYEKLILDEDAGGMARRFRQGITVNPDTLAVEPIKETGPGGHFWDKDHTMEHFRREFWRPLISDRQPFQPDKDYRTQQLERAKQIWQERINSYQRPVLSSGVEKELLEFYRRKFGSDPVLD